MSRGWVEQVEASALTASSYVTLCHVPLLLALITVEVYVLLLYAMTKPLHLRQ